MTGPYINDPGHEVPENTILIVPHSLHNDGFYKEVILPLKGEVKRSWFDSHFYYCLPLNIGNQQGYVIKSLRDFEAIWDGSTNNAKITFLNDNNEYKQHIKSGFGHGIITIQNLFAIKTPPGINIMTIQPPNFFIPGTIAMTGIIETDQIRRDFTFNLKITIPNFKVSVKAGDPIGAFIPVPRYMNDNFNIKLIDEIFGQKFHENEIIESNTLGIERSNYDVKKPHGAGRRYFNGIHTDNTKYKDHQKKVRPETL